MAYDYEPKANPYSSGRKPSRDALDRYFGKPAIDASAPQSALDDTPSGRARRMAGKGKTDQEITQAENASWAMRFGGTRPGDDLTKPLPEAPPAIPPDPAVVKPVDMMRQRTPPKSPLEAIRSANQTGGETGVFSTPYGTVGFDRRPMTGPKLMPDSPLAISGLDSYLSTLGGGTSVAPLFPALAPKKRPSILDDADKWTQPL